MSAHEGSMGDGPRLGAMFGRYRIESVVGRGGMGVVFRATDMDLGRPVALKLLAIDPTSQPSLGAGSLEEARLSASLDHPAIVPVYEAGIVDGASFIAMRLVPGTDLEHLLRVEAPLTLAATLRIVAPIASALDAAHERGLVHGDVKPGNILIESATEQRVYLADFGLTRHIDRTATTTEARPGTLAYMAPELLSGGIIDGRADQYALGCVVAHCLLGHPPFDGTTEAQMVERHLTQEPPSVEAGIPGGCPGLDALLARAMAKQADDRFPDCASFIEALRALAVVDDAPAPHAPARSVPATASPPDPVHAAAPRSARAAAPGSPVRRRPLGTVRGRALAATVVAGLVVLLLVIGSGWLAQVPGPSTPPLPSGVTAAQRDWERAWIARAEDSAVEEGWQRCPSSRIHGGTRDCPARSLDCIPQRSGPQFETGAAVAAIFCRFSSDQVVMNAFLFDFADVAARNAWYATDVVYIGDVRGEAGACAEDSPGEGSWVQGSASGRFACWLRPSAGEVVPHWWLSWYQDSSTRLGLLVSQPVGGASSDSQTHVMAGLLELWRELPSPIGIGSGTAASRSRPAGSAVPDPDTLPDVSNAGG